MKITKSLSLKVNLGNYQVAEFSCEVEGNSNDFPGNPEKEGERLHLFCREQITKDVNNTKKYLQDLANGKLENKDCDGTCSDKNKMTHLHAKSGFTSDPANDLADGEWNVPAPHRNDKRV